MEASRIDEIFHFKFWSFTSTFSHTKWFKQTFEVLFFNRFLRRRHIFSKLGHFSVDVLLFCIDLSTEILTVGFLFISFHRTTGTAVRGGECWCVGAYGVEKWNWKHGENGLATTTAKGMVVDCDKEVVLMSWRRSNRKSWCVHFYPRLCDPTDGSYKASQCHASSSVAILLVCQCAIWWSWDSRM